MRHAINFNRDAGLVSSPLTAIRNPDARHPLHDMLLIKHGNGDAIAHGIQAKYGTPSHVARAAGSAKYA